MSMSAPSATAPFPTAASPPPVPASSLFAMTEDERGARSREGLLPAVAMVVTVLFMAGNGDSIGVCCTAGEQDGDREEDEKLE